MTYSNDVLFDTAVAGDPATTANTRSDVLRMSDGGVAAISAAWSQSGANSLHMTGTSTNGLNCVEDTLGGMAGYTMDIWMKIVTLPASGTETCLGKLLDLALGSQGKVALNGLGAFILRDPAGTNLYSSPSGKRVTAGSIVRLLWENTYGPSGTQRFRWYPLATPTVATDDSTIQPSNNGTNLFQLMRRGIKADTSTTVSEIYFDTLILRGTDPNIASAGPDQSVEPYAVVTLDASLSSGSGTWTLQSNNSHATPTLSSTTVTNPTYTAPADWHNGSVQVWRYTLADGVTYDEVSVTVEPATIGLIHIPSTSVVTALRMTV